MANKTDLIENQNGVGKNKRLQMRDLRAPMGY